MRIFVKTLLLVIAALISVNSTSAYNSVDAIQFVAPKGCTEYGLARKLSIKLDSLRKYNPQLKTRPFKAGMPLCLPASLVSEKELKKIDKAATFVKGGINLEDYYDKLSNPTPDDSELSAESTSDAYIFRAPQGYTLENLSTQLSVDQDVFYRHNPGIGNGSIAGMRLIIPATSVSEEDLKKVDSSPTFVSGALESLKERTISRNVKNTKEVNSDTQFSKEQIESLRARFRDSNLKLVNLNGNKYWYYWSYNTNTTATSLSTKLGIPVETLYFLAELGLKDKLFDENGRLTDFENKKNKLRDFFTHPTTAWGETLVLYFAYDPLAEVEFNRIESIEFSENLKTYNGPFRLKGFSLGDYKGDTNVSDGKATYTYQDASDGSRIFEGEFSFSRESQGSYGHSATARGCFKNDKQVGRWTWDIHFPSETDIHNEILFSENGLPISFDFSKSDNYSFVRGNLKNGKLVSLTYKDGPAGVYCYGKYNADGKPVGDWKIEERGKHGITMSYDNAGNLIKSGYRDSSTGDWIRAWSRYPDELYGQITQLIRRGFCFRSTPF